MKSKIKPLFLVLGIGVFLIISFILYQNSTRGDERTIFKKAMLKTFNSSQAVEMDIVVQGLIENFADLPAESVNYSLVLNSKSKPQDKFSQADFDLKIDFDDLVFNLKGEYIISEHDLYVYLNEMKIPAIFNSFIELDPKYFTARWIKLSVDDLSEEELLEFENALNYNISEKEINEFLQFVDLTKNGNYLRLTINPEVLEQKLKEEPNFPAYVIAEMKEIASNFYLDFLINESNFEIEEIKSKFLSKILDGTFSFNANVSFSNYGKDFEAEIPENATNLEDVLTEHFGGTLYNSADDTTLDEAEKWLNCKQLFDGCNTCYLENGVIQGCTERYCKPEEYTEPACLDK